MLYLSGEVSSVGRVDDGNTVLDYLPQERERGITISSAAITFNWNNHIINLIDTPGHVDFTIEVERSARVLDGAILVIDAVAGVQAQTQTVYKQIKKQNVSTIAFINKMDRDGASLTRALLSIKQKLQANPIALQLPIIYDDSFHGVIDLIEMKKYTWGLINEVTSTRSPPKPIITTLTNTDSMYDEALAARRIMIESIVENDESLMERYLTLLETDENASDKGYLNTLNILTNDEIWTSIRYNCINNTIIPTICGSSLRGKGVEQLLNNMVNYLPAPLDRPPAVLIHTKKSGIKKVFGPESADFCALAFKVVYDHMRGYLVYIRIYSGHLTSKQTLYNSTRHVKERINQLVKISGDDYNIISDAGPGDVVCLIGLKNTYTGIYSVRMYILYIL